MGNIPAQVTVPLLETLVTEMRKATDRNLPFNFSHYIMICKLFKTKTDSTQDHQAVVFSNPEEELIVAESELCIDYDVSGEADNDVSVDLKAWRCRRGAGSWSSPRTSWTISSGTCGRTSRPGARPSSSHGPVSGLVLLPTLRRQCAASQQPAALRRPGSKPNTTPAARFCATCSFKHWLMFIHTSFCL